MLTGRAAKRAKQHLHPYVLLRHARLDRANIVCRYLAGNFAPIHNTLPLTPCSFSGTIPTELAGGQYVRNGGNPLTNEDLGRDAHWFDGDGMLSGVLFKRGGGKDDEINPEFVNQYILTDVYLVSKTTKPLRTPILPSIATLLNPLTSFLVVTLAVLRTVLFAFLSHLPGSLHAMKRISVANTSILWHDGRALATCESGPPMRIQLPSLKTVGWFNGRKAEGELATEADPDSGYGGTGPLSFMKEWTTGHPSVDPHTNELITFHCTFAPPYVHYSIVPATQYYHPGKAPLMRPQPALNKPVPGVSGAKMMHDFGVSRDHTVMLDLPLTLDPLNLARGTPPVNYDPHGKSRFGVFPRHHPDEVRWFETNACCIFHTANTWETRTKSSNGLNEETNVHLLASRLTSVTLVFGTGDIAAPEPTKPIPASLYEKEQCRLYYYQFSMSNNSSNTIRHQWALSAIPFEFPTMREDASMASARYVYGCSCTTSASFSAPLGRAVKIDALAKVDVQELIAHGTANPPQQIKGCVDTRSVREIAASTDPNDPIKIFQMPPGWYAQEPRFIPRENGAGEDDGWLLSYVFDESQLDPSTGECRPDARSELWVMDARNMKDVVARVVLPQRVPYGLHGNWFSEEQIRDQRAVSSPRSLPDEKSVEGGGLLWRAWMLTRKGAEWILA